MEGCMGDRWRSRGRTGFGDRMLAIYYLLTVTLSPFKMASIADTEIQRAKDTEGNQIPVYIP